MAVPGDAADVLGACVGGAGDFEDLEDFVEVGGVEGDGGVPDAAFGEGG